jgi:SAM-dependent methyltransferase
VAGQGVEGVGQPFPINGEPGSVRSERLKLLRAMLRDYDEGQVDPTIAPDDSMVGDNYMEVGAGAVDIVTTAVLASRLTEVKTVLDFPSGHGRVLRHLVKLFPQAEFDVCDLDIAGMAFCVKQFGARSIPPREELTQTVFDRQYDLIWIGSLFTHLNETRTREGLAFLAKQLSPTGIIVSTFHGRWALRMRRIIPYLDELRWEQVLEGYFTKGYGYVDYPAQANYGISAAKPRKLVEIIEDIPGVRIFLYQEKGWSDNHDVIAFGRPTWDQTN